MSYWEVGEDTKVPKPMVGWKATFLEDEKRESNPRNAPLYESWAGRLGSVKLTSEISFNRTRGRKRVHPKAKCIRHQGLEEKSESLIVVRAWESHVQGEGVDRSRKPRRANVTI